MDCGEALVDDPTTPYNDAAKLCDDAAFTFASGDRHYDDNPTGGADPGDWIDNFADDSSDDGFFHFAYNCLNFDVTAMSGTDANEALPSNLSANATIQALAGCAPFSYTGTYANQAPLADAQAKPTTAAVNQNILFDGSGSADDITPADQLIYQWDWDNNGTYDQTGRTLLHKFSTPGAKIVQLRVTDKSTPAKSSTDTVTVNITAPMPDLTIGSYTVSNSSPRRGQTVTLTATVRNIGSATAGATTTQWFRYAANGEAGRAIGSCRHAEHRCRRTADGFDQLQHVRT